MTGHASRALHGLAGGGEGVCQGLSAVTGGVRCAGGFCSGPCSGPTVALRLWLVHVGRDNRDNNYVRGGPRSECKINCRKLPVCYGIMDLNPFLIHLSIPGIVTVQYSVKQLGWSSRGIPHTTLRCTT